MPYRKVLIIRLSALGDVAMTIPVVYSVCRAYPETTFVMLTQKVASQLFINAPRNLQVVVADVKGRHKGFVGLLSSGSGGSSVVHRCRSGFA